MRLKRLCEKKAGGSLLVDEDIHQQWMKGITVTNLALPLSLHFASAASMTTWRPEKLSGREWLKQKYFARLASCSHRSHFFGYFVLFPRPSEAEFTSQMKRVREIQTSREETLHGGWYTEEKMRCELKYSKPFGRKYEIARHPGIPGQDAVSRGWDAWVCAKSPWFVPIVDLGCFPS